MIPALEDAEHVRFCNSFVATTTVLFDQLLDLPLDHRLDRRSTMTSTSEMGWSGMSR